MNWNDARKKIKEKIVEGMDLNTQRSSLRQIIKTGHRCLTYDYNGEEGFLVRISNYDTNNLDIPWSMLEKCFYSLKDHDGYNGTIFRQFYPKQAKNHPCHVHVVGMIFKKSGVAFSDSKEKVYYISKTVK